MDNETLKDRCSRRAFQNRLRERVNRESEIEWAVGFNFKVEPIDKEVDADMLYEQYREIKEEREHQESLLQSMSQQARG